MLFDCGVVDGSQLKDTRLLSQPRLVRKKAHKGKYVKDARGWLCEHGQAARATDAAEMSGVRRCAFCREGRAPARPRIADSHEIFSRLGRASTSWSSWCSTLPAVFRGTGSCPCHRTGRQHHHAKPQPPRALQPLQECPHRAQVRPRADRKPLGD